MSTSFIIISVLESTQIEFIILINNKCELQKNIFEKVSSNSDLTSSQKIGRYYSLNFSDQHVALASTDEMANNARIMKGKTSSRNKPGERLTWGHAREFPHFELLGLLEGSLETSVKGRVAFLFTDTVVDLYSCASSPPSSSLRTNLRWERSIRRRIYQRSNEPHLFLQCWIDSSTNFKSLDSLLVCGNIVFIHMSSIHFKRRINK